ncbi:hypothetical protein [Agrobacterium rosae]|uniref:hypothetical protein n=1 Tax=Agrobacterium rosae TaxID=1972867 RepID=UPI003BA32502
MHQVICVFVLLVVSLLLNAQWATQIANDGNWGEAIGTLLIGPLGLFYFVHTIIYYAVRLIRGPSAVATYSASKLNYIAFAVSLLGILGAVAQRVQPV